MVSTSDALIPRLAAARYGAVSLSKNVAEEAFEALCQTYALENLPVFWATDPVEGYLMATSRILSELIEDDYVTKPRSDYLTGYLHQDACRSVLALLLPLRSPPRILQMRRQFREIRDPFSLADQLAEEVAEMQLNKDFEAPLSRAPFSSKHAWSQAVNEVQAPWVLAGHGLLEHLEPKAASLIEPFLQAYESGLGLYWVFRDGIIAVPRPDVFLENDLFHCEAGPAISWTGGLEFWYWRGVQVTEQIVMRPETLTVEEIVNERNLETKRIMIERFGPAQLIRQGNARLVHRTPQGSLYALSLGSAVEPLVMVRVICPSTSREYWLRVPPFIMRVKEAIAWTFNLNSKNYKPSQET